MFKNELDQTKPFSPPSNRNANYELTSIAKQFKSGGEMVGTCANIQQQIEDGHNYDSSFSNNVSAPYVLARLCALFNGLKIEANGQKSYKTTWEVVLTHTKTGHVLTFYDYKGGISYGSNIYGKETPEDFIKDVKNLLQVLADNRCPHPYDGCVIGEIA